MVVVPADPDRSGQIVREAVPVETPDSPGSSCSSTGPRLSRLGLSCLERNRSNAKDRTSRAKAAVLMCEKHVQVRMCLERRNSRRLLVRLDRSALNAFKRPFGARMGLTARQVAVFNTTTSRIACAARITVAETPATRRDPVRATRNMTTDGTSAKRARLESVPAARQTLSLVVPGRMFSSQARRPATPVMAPPMKAASASRSASANDVLLPGVIASG